MTYADLMQFIPILRRLVPRIRAHCDLSEDELAREKYLERLISLAKRPLYYAGDEINNDDLGGALSFDTGELFGLAEQHVTTSVLLKRYREEDVPNDIDDMEKFLNVYKDNETPKKVLDYTLDRYSTIEKLYKQHPDNTDTRDLYNAYTDIVSRMRQAKSS